MAERGGRGGRGRRGGRTSLVRTAQSLEMSTQQIRKVPHSYEPQPLFPPYWVPRPTKLKTDEINAVRYYKNIRNKILEETPYYITVRKRSGEQDEEDDGIMRYRDRYKPVKSQRQTLRGLPTDESFFPEELRPVLQGSGPGTGKRPLKKYNLDDFLEVANEEDLLDQPEEEPTGPTRTDIIRNDDDDDLEPLPPDPDADEDLDEDDYGEDHFDDGAADFDDYADIGEEDER